MSKVQRGTSDAEESENESSVYSGLSSDNDNDNTSDDGNDDATDQSDDDEESDSESPLTKKTNISMASNNGEHSKIKTSKSQDQVDEYEYDSSDEEDLRNTIGNIPVRWYEEYPHIGYDWDGEKILKPVRNDELDEFLKKMEDPNYWRTVKDKMTGQDVILSDEDLALIQRIQRGNYPDPNYDPYEPFEDLYSHETRIHPLSNRPEHKRSFIPSLIEKKKVSKIVHAIKMGWIKPREARDDEPKFYMLWDNDDKTELSKRMLHYIPAPKLQLPGHEESYNPPPEYLLTKEEEEKWKSMEPEERKLNFIPKKYSSLRATPAYPNFIKERFERCLDLYLCPRQRKMKANVDPEDLIPKLPKPKDLQPFPSVQALVYTGHKDMVRSISVEPSGQFFASGSDDRTVKIWEVITGRCMKTFTFTDIVRCVAWCPNLSVCLVAVAVGKEVHIINPGVGSQMTISNTDVVFSQPLLEQEKDTEGKSVLEWTIASDARWEQGIRVSVTHSKDIHQVTWHGKGDYFATVMPEAGNKAVVIHQLSKRRSQLPFKKSKGLVQRVLFHPLRPYFFVATQRYVRIYNLMKQELTKKLMTNCKWISSIAIHPQGDNVIAGSYDCRLSWFDLDLSTKPYKTLRYHKKAIRQVAYHRVYPLFASASDDGSIIVSHGQVYSDLLKNPLIVPVKVLRHHQPTKDLGVLDCCFHPTHPWLFSAGSDSNIKLFTN